MIGDFVPALIGLVGGLVLLTLLVAVLLLPRLRRLGRARAALSAEVSAGKIALAGLRAARRPRD